MGRLLIALSALVLSACGSVGNGDLTTDKSFVELQSEWADCVGTTYQGNYIEVLEKTNDSILAHNIAQKASDNSCGLHPSMR